VLFDRGVGAVPQESAPVYPHAADARLRTVPVNDAAMHVAARSISELRHLDRRPDRTIVPPTLKRVANGGAPLFLAAEELRGADKSPSIKDISMEVPTAHLRSEATESSLPTSRGAPGRTVPGSATAKGARRSSPPTEIREGTVCS
jgi:hypothetical protein